MKRKILAICMVFVMAVSLAACGEGEETTLTGMVVSVDGTVISLMEMDTGNMGGMDFSGGEMPQMPEGIEGFEGFGDFNPEDFAGDFSQWGNGEMPEDFTMPENFTMPEGGGMPDFGGGMPNFGGNGGMTPGLENFASDAETKDVDIGDAHISVEIDGGKATGSMDDIKAGTFVTITMNGKGEVTNVLVSSRSSFEFGGSNPMT